MILTKKLTSRTLISALCLAICSCGEKKKEDTVESKAKAEQESITHDSVYKELTSNLEEMSGVLATIKDFESAKAAIPALSKLGFKIQMIKTDLEKLGPASKDIAAKLEKEYGPKMKKVQSKISETMKGLETSHPEAYGILDKVMKSIIE
jgi:hypothetical protein